MTDSVDLLPEEDVLASVPVSVSQTTIKRRPKRNGGGSGMLSRTQRSKRALGGQRPDLREARQKSAAARAEAAAKVSPKERLERLDSVFGKTDGAKRERARLQAVLAKKAAPLPAKTVAKPADEAVEESKKGAKRGKKSK